MIPSLVSKPNPSQLLVATNGHYQLGIPPNPDKGLEMLRTVDGLLGPLCFRQIPLSDGAILLLSRPHDLTDPQVIVAHKIEQSVRNGNIPYTELKQSAWGDPSQVMNIPQGDVIQLSGGSLREFRAVLSEAEKNAKNPLEAPTIKNILVTGSCGTIGSAVVADLIKLGFNVIGVDSRNFSYIPKAHEATRQMDLRVRGALDQIEDPIDLVVHLAANPLVAESVKNRQLARDNGAMDHEVDRFMEERGIRKIIAASSREVYGDQGARKDPFHEKLPLIDGAESPYTASKVALEAWMASLRHSGNCHAAVIRYSNVIGPELRYRFGPICVELSRLGHKIVVYGDTKSYDFTALPDAAAATVRLIQSMLSPSVNTTFNVAGGRSVKIVEFAGKIQGEMGQDKNLDVHPNRPGEINFYWADLTRAIELLGYKPTFTFDDIVRSQIKWQQELAECDNPGVKAAFQELIQRIHRTFSIGV